MKTNHWLTALGVILLLCMSVLKAYSQQDRTKPADVTVELSQPTLSGNMSVEEAMLLRRSVRDYTNDAIELDQLAQLLWAAYGLTQEIQDGPDFLRGGLKTAPSAGALYPLEIYVVAGNVKGLEPGVYKYIAEDHSLVLNQDGDVRNQLEDATLNQKMVKRAPVSLVFTAVYSRTTNKYGDRGSERYVCTDLGHSAQNVYLQATSLGLGTCAMGAFTDELVRAVMNIPFEETPLYVMPVGVPEIK
jgi:SagB-type dehydrogenase family enzyme